MIIAYINERHGGVLQSSSPVFMLNNGNDKLVEAKGNAIKQRLNTILTSKGLPRFEGTAKIGLKVTHEPYTFEVTANQSTK